MKHYLFTVAIFTSFSLFAQKTWNHRIPITGISTNPRTIGAHLQGDRLLVFGSRNAVELTELGEITGFAELPVSNLFYNYVAKKTDPQTGKPFLVAGGRRLTSTQGNYRLQIVDPGVGLVSEILLEDTLVGLPFNAPTVLEIGDSNLLVFGLRTLVNVRRQGNSGFSVQWGKYLPYFQGKATAAMATPTGYMMLTEAGEVAVMNDQGVSQVVLQHPARAYFGAVATPDGILACGTDTGQLALLAKFDFSGQLVWTKTYASGVFYDLKTDVQGNIFCTGSSAENMVWLQKCDNQGAVAWSKTYNEGRGNRLFPFPTGHWAVVAQGGGGFTRTFVLRTDETGNTQPYDPNYYLKNRPFRTEGISGTFSPTGSLFFDGSGSTPVTPPDSGSVTVFSFAPWLAGKGQDGYIYLMADDYPSQSSFDLVSGFIGGKTGEFNRVWRATREEIRKLRSDFLADGDLDELVPIDLLTWPGKNNPNNRYNLDFSLIVTNPSLQSAPFVDVNGDGRYNVYDGDYPAIKGDQMLWWPMKDAVSHTNSFGLPLGVDVVFSLYAYDCPQNEALKNTLMADILISNQSGTAYDSTFLAFFIDFDLGCPSDDYIGSLPESNSVFAYNQDAFDDTTCGFPSFEDHIPVQTITFPNQDLDRCMYFNNPTTGSNDPATTDPYLPEERFLYLQGRWKNGIPLTPGGSGYNPSSSIPADFAFPANPADPSGWNMCNANLPLGDRRMLPTKGPFTFGANDTLHTTVVFTTHHNIPHPCPDVFGLVKPAVQNISAWTNGGVMDQIPDLGAVQFLPQGQALNLSPGNFPGATYAWSTGANTPGISVTQPGQYAVTVTTEAGCAYTDAVEVLGSGSGVHAPADAPAWSISPNPASDAVTVRCADCQGLWRARLRNAMGAQVAENRSVEFGKPWSLQGLPAGVYWVELWQEGRPGWGRQLVVVK